MRERPISEAIASGRADEMLAVLYGNARVMHSRKRYLQLMDDFEVAFGVRAEAVFSAPGRIELGGNHTDHQCGNVLAAAVDLDMIAAVKINEKGVITLASPEYQLFEIKTDELTPKAEEKNTPAALVRGVTAGFWEKGVLPKGVGADIYVSSDVPVGSGLSSSAAFEVLLGTVLNEMFCDGKLSCGEIARIGRYAENEYFGKPCGLMDEMACAVGGVVSIDFSDLESPIVEKLTFDPGKEGYAVCILDSGAGHADLTEEYAAVTDEMKAVSGCFGQSVLRRVSEDVFLADLPRVRRAAGDRAVLRAIHFFGENRRAQLQAEALRRGDIEAFLALVRESGKSSAMYLQNIIPAGSVRRQELMLTIALCESLLRGRGAVRVHGGGFGGTALAFVPSDMLERFAQLAEEILGDGSCRVVSVRDAGGVRIL